MDPPQFANAVLADGTRVMRPIATRLELPLEDAQRFTGSYQPAQNLGLPTPYAPLVPAFPVASLDVQFAAAQATVGKYSRPSASPNKANATVSQGSPLLDVDSIKPIVRTSAVDASRQQMLTAGAYGVPSAVQPGFLGANFLYGGASAYQYPLGGLMVPPPAPAPAVAAPAVAQPPPEAEVAPTPAPAPVQEVSHDECNDRIAELELLLSEEKAGRQADRDAATAHESEAVSMAVASAVSKLELKVAELQHALEAEKLKTVEMDTSLMEAISSHERGKAAWTLERQGLLSEAEVAYAGLARSVTDRAQATIQTLRTELKEAVQALEAERSRTGKDVLAQQEATRRTVESATRELRDQIEAERAQAAAAQTELKRQLAKVIADTQASRSSLIDQVESEAAVVIEAARTETAALRAHLEAERQAHAAAQERLKREYDAQCKGFESRLRAKVSRTISMLRQAQGQPGLDMNALLSPLVGNLLPQPVADQQMPEDRAALSPVSSHEDRLAQPVFSESPSPSSTASLPGFGARSQAANARLAHVPLAAAVAGTSATAHVSSGRRAQAAAQPFPLSPVPPAPAMDHEGLSAQADKLMAAADDVLSSVLAGMSQEQRALWAAIEQRMKEGKEVV